MKLNTREKTDDPNIALSDEKPELATFTHRSLRRCFWLIFAIHALPIWLFFALIKISYEQREPSFGGADGLPIAGSGVLAVWFVWTRRPWLEKFARFSLAIGAVALLCAGTYDTKLTIARQVGPLVLLGSLSSAFAASWFFDLKLVPPQIPADLPKTQFSIRDLFLVTTAAAIPFALLAASGSAELRGDWGYQVSLVAIGALAGILASFAAVFAMRDYFSLTTAVLFASLLLLSFFAPTSELISERMTSALLAGWVMCCSPFASFHLLRRHGYRLQSDRGRR